MNVNSRLLLPALLLCAACAPPEPPAAPEADSVAVDTTPAPADDWTITMGGAGTARIGMTPDELRAAGLTVDEDTASLGSACHYARIAEAPNLDFMIEEGTLARIDVRTATPRTDAGDRVGDAEADVLSRHAGAVVQPHKYTDGHYLVVFSPDSTRALVFETDGTQVTKYRAGRLPAVQYVEGCS